MTDFEYKPLIDSKRLFKVRSIKMENDAIAMILDGKGKEVVEILIADKYSISPKVAQETYRRAQDQISSRKDYEIDSIVELHLGRYEEIYSQFIELRSFSNAASVLKAKEKLLQFHKHSTHMKVTNNNISEISIVSTKSDYDTSKLTPEKKERFKLLLDKATREI